MNMTEQNIDTKVVIISDDNFQDAFIRSQMNYTERFIVLVNENKRMKRVAMIIIVITVVNDNCNHNDNDDSRNNDNNNMII